MIATLVLVYALRNKRAKARLARSQRPSLAAPDQANTRIVLDPADYQRVPVDRSGEIVLADVVTLAAEGVRIEVALTAAEAAVFAPLFAELPQPQG